MVYTKDNLQVCLAAPLQIFDQWRDELAAKGFRLISISLAGPRSVPIYTAVMVKYPTPFYSRSWNALSQTEVRNKIDELKGAERPLHPYMIAATVCLNMRQGIARIRMAEAFKKTSRHFAHPVAKMAIAAYVCGRAHGRETRGWATWGAGR